MNTLIFMEPIQLDHARIKMNEKQNNKITMKFKQRILRALLRINALLLKRAIGIL